MTRLPVKLIALSAAAALFPALAAAQQTAPVTSISKADIAAVLQHKALIFTERLSGNIAWQKSRCSR